MSIIYIHTTPVFFEFTGTAAEVISSTREGALKEYIKRTMKIVYEILSKKHLIKDPS